MARDYKNAGSKRRKPPSQGFSGWVGLALGLTLGVALAAGVHLHHISKPEETSGTPAAEAAAGQAATTENTRGRTRFDFYRMLPNYEVVIPEEDIAVTPSQETATVSQTGTYVLQAGSFRSAADADRLRAQLALLGVESRIQTVTIDEADTWHRVRIGPLQDLGELNNVRRRLASNSIEALVIRVGD